MLKAGIDFGLTHVKAHWIGQSGEFNLVSTADRLNRRSLAQELKLRFGITDLCAAGNGPTDGFEGFKLHRVECLDPIKEEISMQAEGALRLLMSERRPPARRHMIVSIGSGTSYAVVDDESMRFPLGSGIGARTVDGLLASFGLHSGPAIDELLGVDDPSFQPQAMPSFDLTLGEAIPSLRGTPKGFYVASHFAKADWHPSRDPQECRRRAAGSAVSMLVTDVAARLLIYQEIEAYADCTDIIVLGMLPTRSKAVRKSLDMTLRLIGKNPIFPAHGEYALAVGAYHGIDPPL